MQNSLTVENKLCENKMFAFAFFCSHMMHEKLHAKIQGLFIVEDFSIAVPKYFMIDIQCSDR